jgi:hypothetical protein
MFLLKHKSTNIYKGERYRYFMESITIGIKNDTWKILMQLKIDENLRTFDDVLKFLLKKRKSK